MTEVVVVVVAIVIALRAASIAIAVVMVAIPIEGLRISMADIAFWSRVVEIAVREAGTAVHVAAAAHEIATTDAAAESRNCRHHRG